MKLIYSTLKDQFIPDLQVDPKKMASDLAMIGHFVSSVTKIEDETVFDLEIRQNRGDCLGYYGLARDLSTLYNLKLKTPSTNPNLLQTTTAKLPISVTATNDVRRIMAVKISGIKNSPSPPWLQKFLRLHDINSINTLVDLTNYIMLLWGLPNHAFDTAKSGDNLIWELNSKYPEFVTLDQVTLKLKPGILMVNNPHQPLSLSFLGGQACAIDLNTSETIIEIATYSRVRVRQDSRFLKTVTEASTRLEKDLDSETIPPALNHLATLIIDLCQGYPNSQVYDYYPQKDASSSISLDPAKASAFAGITIPQKTAIDILQRLGC